MRVVTYLILVTLCGMFAFGAGCLQQAPQGNNTNQTCSSGTCPVGNITSFEQCAQGGYPVTESYPRQCRGPGGSTFTENITQQCQAAGGHWNECSNRCQLDNQGNPNAACTLMCEPLCECAGFAGFRCPSGYTCKAPPGIPDALGYCVVQGAEMGNLTREQAYAFAGNGTCAQEGNLTGNAFYNSNSRTWWIDLDPFHPNLQCNPACVVYENGSTEVNWRCTGLVPPRSDDLIDNMTCTAPGGAVMTLRDALQRAGTGTCAQNGTLTDRHVCNNGTGTWWIDLDPDTPMSGCNPACVVNITTGAEEVNWRCTGLLPPQDDSLNNSTCSSPEGASMILRIALQNAENSTCVEMGRLGDERICNNITGTWWIDLDPYTPRRGCNPACVVNVSTGAAEVNWRCTGALPPTE